MPVEDEPLAGDGCVLHLPTRERKWRVTRTRRRVVRKIKSKAQLFQQRVHGVQRRTWTRPGDHCNATVNDLDRKAVGLVQLVPHLRCITPRQILGGSKIDHLNSLQSIPHFKSRRRIQSLQMTRKFVRGHSFHRACALGQSYNDSCLSRRPHSRRKAEHNRKLDKVRLPQNHCTPATQKCHCCRIPL